MAVPKKKRYKQITRFRRDLQRTNNLIRKNIKINSFHNFVWLEPDDYGHLDRTCVYWEGNPSKTVCLNCYNTHFLGAYVKYKKYTKKLHN